MRKTLAELEADISFETEFSGRKFRFLSTWGLFSPSRMDEGSRLLLDHVEPGPSDDILDIGCGYGAIGIPLAIGAPKGEVHMVDKDFVAVEYAEKNARLNKAANCRVYLSNLFSRVPAQKEFDIIISNVPAKAEREFYDIFLLQARSHLKKGGRLCIVSISGLKEFFKKNMAEIFGNYKKLKQNGRYTAAMSVK